LTKLKKKKTFEISYLSYDFLNIMWMCVPLQWLCPLRRLTAAVWKRECRTLKALPPSAHTNNYSLRSVYTHTYILDRAYF